MKYGSIDQFKADLSLALMVYDYVVDCGPVMTEINITECSLLSNGEYGIGYNVTKTK